MKKSILIALISLFVLGGTFTYLYHRNSVREDQIELYEHNWRAAMDSVEHYKLANGNLLAERAGYILSEKQLTEQLDITSAELRDVQKKLKSKVAQLAEVKSQVRVDTIYTNTITTITNDSLSAQFSYTDNWLSMNGLFEHPQNRTTIYNLTMNTPLTVGMTEDHRYFATSPNPYVHITDITGAVVDKYVPHKQHWTVGVGVGPSVGYDFHHKDIYYGLGILFGLQYNF